MLGPSREFRPLGEGMGMLVLGGWGIKACLGPTRMGSHTEGICGEVLIVLSARKIMDAWVVRI